MEHDEVYQRITTILDGENDWVTAMATVVCELHNAFDHYHWTGFYRATEPNVLKIGPYQGGHGCLVIPFSKGVCGAAARENRVQLVDDVHAFPGHIACSSSTLSEIVLPVRNGAGKVIAVFDIDSNQPAAFTPEDAKHLQKILDQAFANLKSPNHED